MIFSTIFALAALLLTHVAHALPHAEPSTRSTTVRATFDNMYDNPSGSLNSVACSNGANGLDTLFPTFGDIPTFPFIGGAPGIVWNSPNCGGCWKLTNAATGTWIIMTAIDSAATFNIAEEAFVALNGGQVGQGVLNDVVAEPQPPYICGLY
jgi:hypothetical protein